MSTEQIDLGRQPERPVSNRPIDSFNRMTREISGFVDRALTRAGLPKEPQDRALVALVLLTPVFIFAGVGLGRSS